MWQASLQLETYQMPCWYEQIPHSQKAEKLWDERAKSEQGVVSKVCGVNRQLVTARKLVACQDILLRMALRFHMIMLHSLKTYKVGATKQPAWDRSSPEVVAKPVAARTVKEHTSYFLPSYRGHSIALRTKKCGYTNVIWYIVSWIGVGFLLAPCLASLGCFGPCKVYWPVAGAALCFGFFQWDWGCASCYTSDLHMIQNSWWQIVMAVTSRRRWPGGFQRIFNLRLLQWCRGMGSTWTCRS